MRSFLAILIATVQVAGSWLCCCGPERLLARLAEQPGPAVTQIDCEPEPSCPHCRKLEESRNTPRPAPADRPKPCHPVLPESCPCGGATIEAVPPMAFLVVERVLLDSRAAFDSFTINDIAISPTPLYLTGALSELPFLPGETRLFVHHVLRC